MYDIRWIREHPDAFDRGLRRRRLEPLSGKLLALDESRRALIALLEQAQARRNAASKEIGQAKAKKDEGTAQKLIAEMAELKDTLPKLEAQEKEASAALERELAQIPNTPLDDVPDGADETGNVEHHKHGSKRGYSFKPKQHFDLGEALGMMDFELASKLSGARFVVLQKGLARMERALGQFMLDLQTQEHGYNEIDPPLLVREGAMFGTAQLPKFSNDQFYAESPIFAHVEVLKRYRSLFLGPLEKSDKRRPRPRVVQWFHRLVGLERRRSEFFNDYADLMHDYDDEISRLESEAKNLPKGLWLIPTAEVPLTNLVRESIVDEAQLPLRLTACTPCFRAEAGAAGKDTRGMIRQHQFTKVELVSVTTPEQSRDEHERMLVCAEEVLKKLDLHYRVVTLCTGDLGFAAQKTYDIEVWLPGQGAYREISSCSVCGDFQARRMNARYKGKDGKVKGHVHTLNGSGVAVGRALVAVMETYQQADGSIAVPDALQPYMGGMKRIEKT